MIRHRDDDQQSAAALHVPTVALHFSGLAHALRSMDSSSVASIADLLSRARIEGRSVFTLGNGGSAATALHFASDLSTLGPSSSLKSLRTTCLNGNIALFSALANDHGYDTVFARQLMVMLNPADIVIIISASGQSPNCIAAAKAAQSRGATVVALVGFDGGALLGLANVAVHVPVNDYLVVEDAHQAVVHAISRCLRQTGNPVGRPS